MAGGWGRDPLTQKWGENVLTLCMAFPQSMRMVHPKKDAFV